jgi:FKBP-type peptidyl-prolyl cis-trans isomerase FkpA
MIRRSILLAMLCAAAATSSYAAGQASSASAEAAANPLVKIDNVVGTGKEATVGSTVSVHYTGWLYKPMLVKQRGKKFDSSVDRKEPFEFPLGAGKVIKGWDQGVVGMKVGGKRTLIIPSAMAYGPRGAADGMIPANADLIFDVELLDVK